MSWLSAGLSTISGWLYAAERQPKTTPQDLERARQAMLGALGEAGAAANARLHRRIRYAGDLDDLWYLRSDLMADLSLRHGEAQARTMLQPITALFH
jgi:hypothetical protein